MGALLRETFQLESNLLRTLGLLLFRPGRLSIEFRRNRRASFVSPVRLYFFASFAFFLVLSPTLRGRPLNLTMGSADPPRPIPAGVMPAGAMADSVAVALEGGAAHMGRLLADSVSADSAAAPPLPDSLAYLLTPEARMEALRAVLPPDQTRKADDIFARGENDRGRVLLLLLGPTPGAEEQMGLIERFFLSGTIDLLHDPGLVKDRIVGNVPVAMFIVLPLYALLLAVVYFGKRRYLVEHLVFAIHVQSFAFIVFTAMLLVPEGGVGTAVLFLGMLVVPVYYLVALRRYYGEGWLRTLAKGCLLSALHSVLLLPAFILAIFWTI